MLNSSRDSLVRQSSRLAAATLCTLLAATASLAWAQDKQPATAPKDQPKSPATPATPAAPATPAPKPAAPADKPKTDTPATKPEDQKEQLVYVTMETSMGSIVLELDAAKAPLTVKNFLSYMDKGHYNGTIFHRVINNFMIQGGGFTADMKQKPTDPGVKNEWQNGLKNKKYTISMARIGGRPDSGTSQFFINVKDNTSLDMPQDDGAAYAVFGKVISGTEVVDKIKVVKTGMKGGMGDVPVETVTINTVRRATDAEKTPGKGAEPAKTDAPDKK